MHGIVLEDVETAVDKILTEAEKNQFLREMYDAMDNENVDSYKQLVQVENCLDDFNVPKTVDGITYTTSERVLLLLNEISYLRSLTGGAR